jgi:hypothetical protein
MGTRGEAARDGVGAELVGDVAAADVGGHGDGRVEYRVGHPHPQERPFALPMRLFSHDAFPSRGGFDALLRPNGVLPQGLYTETTVAVPSMSTWAKDKEIKRVVGADASDRIVLSSTTGRDGAATDCRTKRPPKWRVVTITPTVNASFVTTQ